MPTILNLSGFRFVIWPDDHEPPHVHVFKGGGEVKIRLGNTTTEPPTIMLINKMSKQEVRFLLQAVIDNQDTLIKRWGDIHG